jgi:cytochrome bd-type quinol oxidase subunit 2
VSEEKKKTKAEAVEHRLKAIGELSLLGSIIVGFGFCSDMGEKTSPTNDDFLQFFIICSIGAGLWLLCFLARYILKRVTDEAKKERPNEGVHRLSIFAGGVSAFLWVVWFLQYTRPELNEPLWWLLIIVASVGFFFVGLALVRAVAWVISGFTRK